MVKTERKQTLQGQKISAFHIVNTFLMAFVVVATLFPLYYVFIVSISNGLLVTQGLVGLVPRGINIEAYKMIFNYDDIWISYKNTLVYTVLGTAINMLFSIFCAYPLSRKHFYGRTFFVFMATFTMFFSGGLIPTYLVVQQLGMVNKIWAIVLPGAISTFNMIIIRTFFSSLPSSLEEAAYLDGANDIQILMKIMLPLSKPVLATITLYYAVGHWNSFFSALIYLNEKSRYPLQLLLRNIVIGGEFSSQELGGVTDFAVVSTNYKYAVIIVSVLPILTIYPFIQKYFTKGVMIGALKG